MVPSEFIRIMAIISIMVGIRGTRIKSETLEEYTNICENVTSKPFFDLSMVVRKKWTIYYNWNVKIDNACPQLYFKYPNELVINRIYKAMSVYLKKQPLWHDAVLLMKIGSSQEILLFNDPRGTPGRLLGVPNMREEDIHGFQDPKITLIPFAMKLIKKGKYLIISDCRMGVTSMAVHQAQVPSRAEINTVAATFNFGDGFPACINGPNHEEEK